MRGESPDVQVRFLAQLADRSLRGQLSSMAEAPWQYPFPSPVSIAYEENFRFILSDNGDSRTKCPCPVPDPGCPPHKAQDELPVAAHRRKTLLPPRLGRASSAPT